jgi:hypothetical protein
MTITGRRQPSRTPLSGRDPRPERGRDQLDPCWRNAAAGLTDQAGAALADGVRRPPCTTRLDALAVCREVVAEDRTPEADRFLVIAPQLGRIGLGRPDLRNGEASVHLLSLIRQQV